MEKIFEILTWSVTLSVPNTTQALMTDTFKAVYCVWQNALMCLFMTVCFGLFMSSGPTESGHPALKSKDVIWPTTRQPNCVSFVCCMFYRGGNLSPFHLMVNSVPGPHGRNAALASVRSSFTYLLLAVFSLFQFRQISSSALPVWFSASYTASLIHHLSLLSSGSCLFLSLSISYWHVATSQTPLVSSCSTTSRTDRFTQAHHPPNTHAHTPLTHICEDTINGLQSQSARGPQ